MHLNLGFFEMLEFVDREQRDQHGDECERRQGRSALEVEDRVAVEKGAEQETEKGFSIAPDFCQKAGRRNLPRTFDELDTDENGGDEQVESLLENDFGLVDALKGDYYKKVRDGAETALSKLGTQVAAPTPEPRK